MVISYHFHISTLCKVQEHGIPLHNGYWLGISSDLTWNSGSFQAERRAILYKEVNCDESMV